MFLILSRAFSFKAAFSLSDKLFPAFAPTAEVGVVGADTDKGEDPNAEREEATPKGVEGEVLAIGVDGRLPVNRLLLLFVSIVNLFRC